MLPEYVRSLVSAAKRLRLGSNYGGWVIPAGVLNDASICYCVGCGEDISFDLALIDLYQCEVFAFDPTPRSATYVRGLTSSEPRYHFEDIGVWNEDQIVKFYEPRNSAHVSHSITNLQDTDDYISVPVRRLERIMRDNAHSQLSLLKLDIEGAETTVLESIVSDRIEIGVLLVEFDQLLQPTLPELRRCRSVVRALQNIGYRLFWIEGRNLTLTLTRQARPRTST